MTTISAAGRALTALRRQDVAGQTANVGLAGQELVDGRELRDGRDRGAVVHRNDHQAGTQLIDDAGCPVGVNREKAADRHQDDVHGSNRRQLFVVEEVPQIAEVGDAQTRNLENEDGVETPLRSAFVVVIDADGSDGDVLHLFVDLRPTLLVGGQAPQDAGVAADQGRRCCGRRVRGSPSRRPRAGPPAARNQRLWGWDR